MVFVELLLPISTFAIIYSHDRPKRQPIFVFGLILFGLSVGVIGYSIYDNFLQNLKVGNNNLFEMGGTFALAILTGTALLITVWSGFEQRVYFRKSVTPYIAFKSTYKTNDQNGIKICNSGLGPAVIKSIFIKHSGVEYKGADNDERWKKFVADLDKRFPDSVNTMLLLENSVISPKEEDDDLVFCEQNMCESCAKKLIDFLTKIEIEIHFSDIYGREQPTSNFNGKFFFNSTDVKQPEKKSTDLNNTIPSV